jgi:hypothetical protein
MNTFECRRKEFLAFRRAKMEGSAGTSMGKSDNAIEIALDFV